MEQELEVDPYIHLEFDQHSHQRSVEAFAAANSQVADAFLVESSDSASYLAGDVAVGIGLLALRLRTR